jgi:hypothetical protein
MLYIFITSLFLSTGPSPELQIQKDMRGIYSEYYIARSISQRFLFDFLTDGINITSAWKENNDGIIEFENGNHAYISKYVEKTGTTIIFRLETKKRDYVHHVSSPRPLSEEEEDVFYQTVKWQILSLFEEKPMGIEELYEKVWNYPVE